MPAISTVDPANHLPCVFQAQSTAIDDVGPYGRDSHGMALADRNTNGLCLLTGGSSGQGSVDAWPDPLDSAYQEPPAVYEEPPNTAQQDKQQAQVCYKAATSSFNA
jgi:hypothetical protein